MNMIYENRRRSASNHPFLRAFLWLLFFCFLFTTQLSVYTVITLKNHTEKNGEYCLVCEALLINIDRQSV